MEPDDEESDSNNEDNNEALFTLLNTKKTAHILYSNNVVITA